MACQPTPLIGKLSNNEYTSIKRIINHVRMHEVMQYTSSLGSYAFLSHSKCNLDCMPILKCILDCMALVLLVEGNLSVSIEPCVCSKHVVIAKHPTHSWGSVI